MKRYAFLPNAILLVLLSLLGTGCALEAIPGKAPQPLPASTTGKLDISITTRTYNGTYPAYVLAAWIEDSTGAFVKTVKVYGNYTGTTPVGAHGGYLPALLDWIAAGGEVGSTAAIDGWTGATRLRSEHGTVTAVWDLKKRGSATLVPDGSYRIQVEYTEDNAHLTRLTSTTKNAVLPVSVGGGVSAPFSMTSSLVDISAVYTPAAP